MTDLKERLIESIEYSVVLVLVALGMSFFLVWKVGNVGLILSSGVVGMAVIVFYLYQPYDKEKLVIRSWISLIAVILMGVGVGKLISISNLIGIGFGISIADLISFTRFGSKTTNGRLWRIST